MCQTNLLPFHTKEPFVNKKKSSLYITLIFPLYTGVPKSETFDLTLIILLLRNLTDLKSPHGGFDRLPTTIETTPASDLARIKYYRNYMAHRHDAKLDNLVFNTAWEVVSEVSDILWICLFSFVFFIHIRV